MKDDYIKRQEAIEAFGLSEKTRKYGGDHSGYSSIMLYEVQDTLECIDAADVIPLEDAIEMASSMVPFVPRSIVEYAFNKKIMEGKKS